MALLMINDVVSLPSLPVTVGTDWWMLGLQLLIALLSFFGTILGVVLGVKYSLKNFYSQRWWEKKADVYSQIVENVNFYYIKMIDLAETLTIIINRKDKSISYVELEDRISEQYEVIKKIGSKISEQQFHNTIYISTEVESLINKCAKDIVNDSNIHFPMSQRRYDSLLAECEKIIDLLIKAKLDIEKEVKVDLKINNNK